MKTIEYIQSRFKPVTIYRGLVNPKIAEQLLTTNTQNRKLKEHKIAEYSEAILKGGWKAGTTETIKIDKSGKLIDGQNRLTAIVRTGTPAYLDIATNVDESLFSVLDTGQSRDAKDTLYLKGVKNEKLVSNIILAHCLYERPNEDGSLRLKNKITNEKILQIYFEREKFWELTVKKVQRWYSECGHILSSSQIGGFYTLFYKINEIDADIFMEQLISGNGIKTDAIRQLRKRLIANKISKSKKMTLKHIYALGIKTWNFFRLGHNTKILAYTNEEKLPIAI